MAVTVVTAVAFSATLTDAVVPAPFEVIKDPAVAAYVVEANLAAKKYAATVEAARAALVVRGANAYGPCQYPEKLIPLHITNAIDDQPLPVYGDGQQRRQWTHVEDFASGVDTVLRRGRPGEIYNIGSPEPEAALPVNLEVSQRILSAVGKPESLIQYVKDRPGHDRRYALSSAKLMDVDAVHGKIRDRPQ